MGSLNAIVFSCGTITIYLTGVDVQRLPAVPRQSKPPPPSPRSFRWPSRPCPSLIGMKPVGKSLQPTTDPILFSRSDGSNEPGPIQWDEG